MNSPLLTIVTPTFNEEVNVLPFLAALRRAIDGACDYEVLFVDDSTDSTPEIVLSEGKRDPRVRLLHRPRELRDGLAGAYRDGFHEARGTYICCLDADLQHPPEKISELLARARTQDADVVVASRYIVGGSGTAGLDNMYRKAVSVGSKYLAQFLFKPLRLSSDPGGGFYLFRREIIDGVVLRPLGYKMLMEIMVRCAVSRVVDVPYTLRARERGTSKATLKQGVAFLHHCAWLYTTTPGIGWLRLRAFFIRPHFSRLAEKADISLRNGFRKKSTAALFSAFVLFAPFSLGFALGGSIFAGIAVVFAFWMSLQGLFHAYLLLDAWQDPARARGRGSPRLFLAPRLSFTALIPARYESAVIGETIRTVAAMDYPSDLTEALVICRRDDSE
ncbi:MAG: glycosyltransferase, partial [Patescibacteria group bacterium]|nr:glycosyltransferase [Patescibacteria group bacterium]